MAAHWNQWKQKLVTDEEVNRMLRCVGYCPECGCATDGSDVEWNGERYCDETCMALAMDRREIELAAELRIAEEREANRKLSITLCISVALNALLAFVWAGERWGW